MHSVARIPSCGQPVAVLSVHVMSVDGLQSLGMTAGWGKMGGTSKSVSVTKIHQLSPWPTDWTRRIFLPAQSFFLFYSDHYPKSLHKMGLAENSLKVLLLPKKLLCLPVHWRDRLPKQPRQDDLKGP